jgi:hypothetical protein
MEYIINSKILDLNEVANNKKIFIFLTYFSDKTELEIPEWDYLYDVEEIPYNLKTET